ncbi:hypothetical protein GYMLUDRAFT_247090 [Collybiopsis luxurians FD-317 M1]|uniref:Ribosomal RNA-processing protein 43 n=1 Tax=Collybiopsis luxurians FD-317 M1 TaxID=944289 RepID=A0A0D0CGY1_9AGAR|nr:hypothetical protein GYMLUDRAFT_247090 [Collybiopsis luxurians FD-317 M1]
MASSDALKAATFQRLHPRIYLERFLEERVRPDGRSIDDDVDDGERWRNVEVNVGSISTAHGSALVRLGNTTVVCGVKGEICEPELDNPDQVPNVDLPALCSPKFKPGPPTEEAQILSERLNQVLIGNSLIPLSSLCISSGKSVWVLYVDATVINYDGNVFDAALIAMVCALRNVSLPHAEYDLELDRTICTRPGSDPSKPAKKLVIQQDVFPMAYSFGVFAGSRLLPDPTAFEEPLLDTTISIVLDPLAKVLTLSQLGAGLDNGNHVLEGDARLDPARAKDTLTECINLAKKRHAVLIQKVYGT